jgi:hypothetical protein
MPIPIDSSARIVSLRSSVDVERVEAHCLHAPERTAHDVARIAFVRLAVGLDDVADEATDLGLAFTGRHQAPGGGIGDRDHVRLLDRVEAGDRRPVEAHAVVQGALDLGRRDRKALQVPFDVREPEEDVLDALFLHLVEHSLTGLGVGSRPVLAFDHCHSASSSRGENERGPSRITPAADPER